MRNMLNNKALRPEDGGSIPAETLGGEFNGVKFMTPFWSIGFSQEGDGPQVGQRFDWFEGSFIVVKLGLSGRERCAFTAMAVARA